MSSNAQRERPAAEVSRTDVPRSTTQLAFEIRCRRCHELIAREMRIIELRHSATGRCVTYGATVDHVCSASGERRKEA